jgi:hypothetical protein
MTAVDEVEALIERYKLATAEFLRGNAEPYKMLFSHEEDVTLANPFFPIARGWDEVAETLERTASRLRDGEFLGSEIIAKQVTPELAYVVQLARERAKGWCKRDPQPDQSTKHDGSSARRWHLEDRAPSRRSDNHPSAGRVGDTAVEPSRTNFLERMP